MSHFINLLLSDWNFAHVNEPVIDPNLLKDPRAVSTAISLSLQTDSGSKNIPSNTDLTRNIVAVTHCLSRLQKLFNVSRFFIAIFVIWLIR